MAGSGITKIDSNITGQRFSEEESLCVLASNPIWYDTEPNNYPADYGGEITSVARNYINPGRQRFKGTPVDKDAASGYNQDLTQTNTQRLMRGHFFANYGERFDTRGFTRGDAGTEIAITSVATSDDSYNAASGLDGLEIGDLVFASNFTNSGNNGLKSVATAASAKVTVNENLVDEGSPPANARLTVVGFQFGSGEIDIDVSGDFATFTRASGTKDFTDFGLIPGEPVYVGGDGAGTSFTTAANNGRKRVRSVTATTIVFDKSDEAMSNETGTGLTIQLFLPSRTIKNESNPDNQVRRSVQWERTLGSNTGDANKQAQYVIGGVPSEFAMNLETASLATVDLSYVAADSTSIDKNNLPAFFDNTNPQVVADDIKSLSSNLGSSVVTVDQSDAFNTSSDISRIRLASVSTSSEAPSSIVGYLQSLTLTINQNAEGNKALGVFGSFEISVGTFEVSAALTGYFSDVAAISAVENATDVTLDFWQVKANAGIVFDLPLLTLSDGRPTVEQDSPITIPLNSEAASAIKIATSLNHTLMMSVFDYLPDAADS